MKTTRKKAIDIYYSHPYIYRGIALSEDGLDIVVKLGPDRFKLIYFADNEEPKPKWTSITVSKRELKQLIKLTQMEKIGSL